MFSCCSIIPNWNKKNNASCLAWLHLLNEEERSASNNSVDGIIIGNAAGNS